MPLYDYQCTKCSHVFELRQSFDSEPSATCPKCSNVSRRKFYPVPIIYKGSGFYTTDYKRGNSGNVKEKTGDKDESKNQNTDEKKGEAKAKNTDDGSQGKEPATKKA